MGLFDFDRREIAIKFWVGLVLVFLAGKAAVADEASPWIELFNGKDLTGWAANDHPESYSVIDEQGRGVLKVCGVNGGSHLYYVGGDNQDDQFRNFEFETWYRAEPESNSGFFFHTSRKKRPKTPWLAKGYEVQLNTTKKEKRKTGSLYAVKDILRDPERDETKWSHLSVRVEEKRIQISINGDQVLDYTEPEIPARPKGRKGRLISPTGGAIAIQAHDPKSVYYFRDMQIRKLPSRDFDTLAALNKLYRDLDAKNHDIIQRMTASQKIEDKEEKVSLVRKLFQEQDAQWKEFVPLMEYAIRHPKEEVSLKSAVLTLMCSSDDGRDMACDLILNHHVESEAIAPALGRMLYTSRAKGMLRKVLEKNQSPSVVAHAKVALANTLRGNPSTRPEAVRLMMEVFEQQPQLPYRAPYWGVPQPAPAFSEVAANMLARMSASDATEVGKTLPPLKAVDFEGNHVQVAELKNKVTMISFWAHWCGPCMAMVPAEVKLVEAFKDAEFELVGICGDDFDDELPAKSRESGITWRNLRNELPDGSTISESFGISGWPTILIVDQAGKVLHRSSGSSGKPDAEFEHYRQLIQRALDGKF